MKFRVILADPPWEYADRKSTRKDNPDGKPKFGIGAHARYSAGTSPNEDLATIGIHLEKIAAPDAYLLMWATMPNLPQAIQLGNTWGYNYVTTAFTWVKTTSGGELFSGPGRYTFSNTEIVLLFRDKKRPCWHSATGYRPNQVQMEPHPRSGDGKIIHSRKPAIFHALITAWLQPRPGECLELFATEHTEGWTCMGHQLSGLDIRQEIDQYERRQTCK